MLILVRSLILGVLLVAGLLSVALAGTLGRQLYGSAGSISGWVDVSAGVAATTNAKLGDATGTCTYTDNTDSAFIKNGRGKNIKLVATGGTTSTTFCRLIWQPTAKSFQNIGTFSWRWYTDQTSTAILSSSSYDITNDTGGNNGFRFDPLNNQSLIQQGWNYQQWFRDQSTVLGTGTWSTTMARTHFQVGVESNQTVTIYIDEHTYGAYQSPKVMPILVGAYSEHYTTAWTKFTLLGIKGTLVVPTSKLGTGGRMTSAQVTEMYVDGWTVIHAGTDETSVWTGMSQAQIEADILQAEQVMIQNGWTRDIKRAWLPGTTLSLNRHNATVDAALAARGITSAIGPWDLTISSGQHLNGSAIDPVYGIAHQPYHQRAYTINNPESQADVLALQRAMMAKGAYLPVMIGRITASPVSGEMATADFNAVFEQWRRTAGTQILSWGRFLNALGAGRVAP